MTSFTSKVAAELGINALVQSHRDVKILCLQRMVRMFAYGATTLILTLFLLGLGHDAAKTGLFMTLTLLGDVVISLVLTVIADKIGRRRMLALGSLLMTASGVVFAIFSQYWILVLASVLGVISPSGNEIGPFKAIEESTISQLVSSTDRGSILAWYLLSGTAGAALGTITFGWIVHGLQSHFAWSAVNSYRLVFWVYALLGLVKLALSLILSPDCEVKRSTPKEGNTDQQEPLLTESGDVDGSENIQPSESLPTPKPRRNWLTTLLPEMSTHTASLLVKLCLLFGIDSLASGAASTSWLVLFFHDKFGLQEGTLGSLFFFTNILSSASNLAAASLAKRIGLIKTMVFTHLPGSLALSLLPVPNNEIISMALLLFRSSIASMDQAPRQAFLAAAVLPEERTMVMGIVNVAKTLSQSGGPIVTGLLAQANRIRVALILAGALKCSYDVLMLSMFLGYRTIEEKTEGQSKSDIEMDRAESANQGRGNP